LADARLLRKVDRSATPFQTEKAQLQPFDPTRGDGVIDLKDLIGQAEIEAIRKSGSIEFLATGDTGGEKGTQKEVAHAMRRDFIADQRVRYANAPGMTCSINEVYGCLRVHVGSKLVQAMFVRSLGHHRDELETVAIDLSTSSTTQPEFED
jgi:hypothetical protein